MRKERVKLRIIGAKIKTVRKEAIGYFVMNPGADLPQDPKLIKRGMTQKEFADALGVSLDTVKNWEQGYNYPRIEDIDNICKMFKCRYDYLFGADDKMQEDLGLSRDALFVLRETKKWGASNVVSHLLEDIDFIEALVKLTDTDYPTKPIEAANHRGLAPMGTSEIVFDIIKSLLAAKNFVERERKALRHKPLKYYVDSLKIANLHPHLLE